ncbi:MAG: hypothetical protein WC372_07840 [Candidatus Neomarinimicrobiota bacterium]|jgi:hypothetical protein
MRTLGIQKCLIALAVLLLAGCYAPSDDTPAAPGVVPTTVILSGEVTGDMAPEARTMSMRVTAQVRNYVLLEIFGMESFCDTRSVDILQKPTTSSITLEIVDNGTPGTERCYRNLQFWVGSFDYMQNYTIQLIEANTAVFKDTLSATFDYSSSVNMTVNGSNYGYWLSEFPFLAPDSMTPYFDSSDLPDSLSKYSEYAADSIYFETGDTTLRVFSIVSATCSMLFEPYVDIENDTLIMYATSDEIPLNACETSYYFFYDFSNYIGQVFYYKFVYNNYTMYDGFYKP